MRLENIKYDTIITVIILMIVAVMLKFTPLDLSGHSRQAKSILMNELKLFKMPPRDIDSKRMYGVRPSYIEAVFPVQQDLEKFCGFYEMQAGENGWKMTRKAISGNDAEMEFIKQLTDSKGTCTLYFRYETEKGEFIFRMTWFDEKV